MYISCLKWYKTVIPGIIPKQLYWFYRNILLQEVFHEINSKLLILLFFFTKHWCTKIERQKKIFKCYLFIYLFIHLFCRIGSNLHAVIVSVISLYCFMFDAETTSNPVVWEKFLPALIALFSCRSCLWSHKCHLIRQLHFVFFQCFWTDSTEMMQYLQEWVFLLQWVTSLQVPNE